MMKKCLDAVKEAVEEIERLEKEIQQLKKGRFVLLPGCTYIIGNTTITIDEPHLDITKKSRAIIEVVNFKYFQGGHCYDKNRNFTERENGH